MKGNSSWDLKTSRFFAVFQLGNVKLFSGKILAIGIPRRRMNIVDPNFPLELDGKEFSMPPKQQELKEA